MSMLAERRSKRKWCLNPNGKQWSNDDNKLGQRLLEKMGWKKGCGLGVNLQGMKEHVKVSAKNDTKGLGCKNTSDNEWICHQQNFESLLSELSSTVPGEAVTSRTVNTTSVSLEEKSKKSRARVHYQKFTRGKDVSRYSAKDLACIFGKKNGSQDDKMAIDTDSCNLRNIPTDNSNPSMTSYKHSLAQGLESYEENDSDVEEITDILSSLPHKHKNKDGVNSYRAGYKHTLEQEIVILKEISNVNEISSAKLNVAKDSKSIVEDDTASEIGSECLGKNKNKRKERKNKVSENSEEVCTTLEPSVSGKQVNEVIEVSNEIHKMRRHNEEKMREEKKKKKKEKERISKKQKRKKGDSKMEEEHDDDDDDDDDKTLKDFMPEGENIQEGGLSSISLTDDSDIKHAKKKRKKVCKISDSHEEYVEESIKKKNKNRKRSHASVSENIVPVVIVSSSDDEDAEGDYVERSKCLNNKSFSSPNPVTQQNDHSTHKHPKTPEEQPSYTKKQIKARFKGSNLHTISGYGSL